VNEVAWKGQWVHNATDLIDWPVANDSPLACFGVNSTDGETSVTARTKLQVRIHQLHIHSVGNREDVDAPAHADAEGCGRVATCQANLEPNLQPLVNSCLNCLGGLSRR
jgi:hypothetical protein